MFFFKKVKNNTAITGDAQSKMISRWNAFKEKTAQYLQQQTELMSKQNRKYCLIFFCLLFGGSSIAIAIHAAVNDQPSIVVTKISRPAYSLQEKKNFPDNDSLISRKEYDKVMQSKAYLLQLKNDPATKKKYDSIIAARPQLTDSIDLFEKMYLQQQ